MWREVVVEYSSIAKDFFLQKILFPLTDALTLRLRSLQGIQFPSLPFAEKYHNLSPKQQIAVTVFGVVVGVTSLVGFYCGYNYLNIEHLRGYRPPTKEIQFTAAKQLRVRVINLDGALPLQADLFEEYQIQNLDFHEWGPALRIECFWWTTLGFEQALTDAVGSPIDDDPENKPLITFYGSNDFHHVALSLIRRWHQPFNLVIFDNHPDWFRMYPIGLHCGCWFTHAMNLPTVQSAYHFGGDSSEFLDKDGYHPWKELESGKLAFFPSRKDYGEFKYKERAKYFEQLRAGGYVTKERAREILAPHKERLAKYPLYITLDKDCMRRSDNLQNWNSGELSRSEVLNIISVLIEFSNRNLLAMDITGDYTKVNVCGEYRHHLHHSQHSVTENNITQEQATPGNQVTNLAILKTVQTALEIPQHLS